MWLFNVQWLFTTALNNEEATGRSCLKHSIIFISDHSVFMCLLCSDNPSQIGSVSVAIRIMDINDNPPSLTPYYEAFVCENAKAGQVRPHIAEKHTHTPNVWCSVTCRFKLIHTLTATDVDDTIGGQHFYYSLAPEAAKNPNFKLRDNQGVFCWNWSLDSLIDTENWLLDWLIEWESKWVSEWGIEWLIDFLFSWLVDYETDWFVVHLLVCWIFGWLIDWAIDLTRVFPFPRQITRRGCWRDVADGHSRSRAFTTCPSRCRTASCRCRAARPRSPCVCAAAMPTATCSRAVLRPTHCTPAWAEGHSLPSWHASWSC